MRGRPSVLVSRVHIALADRLLIELACREAGRVQHQQQLGEDQAGCGAAGAQRMQARAHLQAGWAEGPQVAGAQARRRGAPSIVAPLSTDSSTARQKPGRSLCMRLPAAVLSESSAGVGGEGEGRGV